MAIIHIPNEEVRNIALSNALEILPEGGAVVMSLFEYSFIRKSGDAFFITPDFERSCFVGISSICVAGLYRKRHFLSKKRDYQDARPGEIKRGDQICFSYLHEDADEVLESEGGELDATNLVTNPALLVMRMDQVAPGETDEQTQKRVSGLLGRLGLGHGL